MDNQEQQELIERLKKHKKTCREWKLAGKDYDENTHVPFFCSEVETDELLRLLEQEQKIKAMKNMDLC